MLICGVIRRWPRFRRKCPAAVLCPVGVPHLRDARRRERRQSAFGLDLTVVSQLLAGSRSGPGGSPAPPRALRCDEARRDTAPRPASRRLAMTPLRGRGDGSVWDDGSAGITKGGLGPETDWLTGRLYGQPIPSSTSMLTLV